MITRRAMLAGLGSCMALAPSGAMASATSRPGTRLDSLVEAIDPVLEMRNAHTSETIQVRFYDQRGYRTDEIRRLNWFMRDWRQGEAVQMDTRLFWALAAIRMAAQQDGNDGEITLLSGFRSPRTNEMLRSRGVGAARNSLHLLGKAADITIPGTRLVDLAAYARWLQVGGVGTYSRSNFVHIDSGNERRWGA